METSPLEEKTWSFKNNLFIVSCVLLTILLLYSSLLLVTFEYDVFKLQSVGTSSKNIIVKKKITSQTLAWRGKCFVKVFQTTMNHYRYRFTKPSVRMRHISQVAAIYLRGRLHSAWERLTNRRPNVTDRLTWRSRDPEGYLFEDSLQFILHAWYWPVL